MGLNFPSLNPCNKCRGIPVRRKISFKERFSGNGTTERSAQITATVAVRVMQVLSNGNLYVEGAKETTVNRERQYVTLAGIIRPEDISSLNTITSDAISDLRVELSGDGVVTDKQRPGWLTNVLDNVWPF